MIKIKPSSVAGKFYTNDKEELRSQLAEFNKNNKKDYEYSSRALIMPHAGYYYSGQIASEGIQYLDKNVKNIFIIAPCHYVPVTGIALSSYDQWSTPLGEIDVNVLAIAHGSSDVSIRMVVEGKHDTQAVRALHELIVE